MQHNFILNTYSFPVSNKETAYELMLDATQGIFQVGQSGDRYALYRDSQESFYDYKIAPEYTLKSFLLDLHNNGELDLQVLFYELEDKTPAINFLDEQQFLEVADSVFYFPGQPYVGSLDVISIAWALDATLFSAATAEMWCKSQVEFCKQIDNGLETNRAALRNVSKKSHGSELRQLYEATLFPALTDAFDNCAFTDEFLEWFDELQDENKVRVRKKLSLASALSFSGGEPLFKTLVGTDKIREVRFSAHTGGAIRILFARIADNKWVMLNGFIKKSNDEGYEQAIPQAERLLNNMVH